MIKRFEREDFIILEESQLSLERLDSFFNGYEDIDVYVTQNQKLVGLITIGDYARHLMEEGNLVNRKFTFGTIYESEEAHLLKFERSSAIKSVVVVDEEEHICYGYKKISEETNYSRQTEEYLLKYCQNDCDITYFGIESITDQSRKTLLEVLKEFGFQKVVILYEQDWTLPKLVEQYQKIFQESFRVETLCGREYRKVISDTSTLIVIDLCTNNNIANVREDVLAKHNIPYIGGGQGEALFQIDWWKWRNHAKDWAEFVGNHYGNIWLVGEDRYSRMVEEILNQRKAYSCQRMSFKEYENCKKNWDGKELPELIIGFDWIVRKESQVISGRDGVYGTSIYLSFYRMFLWFLTLQYDIAQNIVPQLKQQGVQVCVAGLNNLSQSNDKILTDKNLSRYSGEIAAFKNSKVKEELIQFFDYPQEILEELPMIRNIYKGAYICPSDHHGKYCNVVNGIRVTTNKPDVYTKNRIIIFGPCWTFGINLADKDTIASYLQRMNPESEVINMASHNYVCIPYRMREFTYQKGDIVLVFARTLTAFEPEDRLDLTPCMERIENPSQLFWDSLEHMNHHVVGYIAQEAQLFLEKKCNFEREENTTSIRFGSGEISSEGKMPVELEVWLKEHEYLSKSSDNNGSIVMNCNPLTKGHLYLIETAASQVTNLFIFVVEEDKSAFTYQERFYLVKEGTKHLPNVTVLGSGKYIISDTTMPGYFDKDNLQDSSLNAAEDMELFGKYIAPFFEIKKRFVGEEPKDNFTRQYNDALNDLLPGYGIEVFTIPRKKMDDDVISASLVRKYCKEGRWDMIQRLVPQVTYEFLRRREG